MYDDLKITSAIYEHSTDLLLISALSGDMILHFSFCGNQFRVETPNDLVDAWIAIPAMIDLLAKETKPDDAIAHVDAAMRLADAYNPEAYVTGWDD